MLLLVLGLTSAAILYMVYRNYRKKAAKFKALQQDIEEAVMDSKVLDMKGALKKILKSNQRKEEKL